MKNKRSLIAAVIVCVLGVIGGTYAFYSTSNLVENVFTTGKYLTTATETFESPVSWTPGTETEKTVVAHNSGDIDVAVRMSLSEEWTDASGGTLSLTDNQSPANRYAIINFADDFDDKWKKVTENGTDYYYYRYKLSSDMSTSSLLKSVTFNPDAHMTVISDDSEDASTHTKTYTRSMDGHAGGQNFFVKALGVRGRSAGWAGVAFGQIPESLHDWEVGLFGSIQVQPCEPAFR